MADEQEQPKQDQPKPARPGIADNAIALRPRNFEELWGYCKIICDTDFVAPADRGKPGQVLAKIQYGNEIGLPPMQSLRWIVHINGVPTVFSDGFWMVVRAHPLTEWVDETPPEVALEQGYAEVTIQRRGAPKPTVRRFSVKEAETAGLIERSGAKGPWNLYRGNQLVWRARHRCATAAVPEALGGLVPTEIARDYDYEIAAEPQKEPPIAIPQPLKAVEGGKKDAATERKSETAEAPRNTLQSPDRHTAGAGSQPQAEPEPEKKPPQKTSEPEKQPRKEVEQGGLTFKDQVLKWIKDATTDELISLDPEVCFLRKIFSPGSTLLKKLVDPERREVLLAYEKERDGRPDLLEASARQAKKA